MKYLSFTFIVLFVIGCNSSVIVQNKLLVANYQYKQAIENYKKEIAKNQHDDALYYHLAQAYFEAKQYNLAEKNIKLAMILKPDQARYLFLRGEINYYRKNYFLAITQLRSVIKLDQTLLDSYYYLSMSYYDIGDMQQAINIINIAVQLEPHYFPFIYAQVNIEFHDTNRQIANTNKTNSPSLFPSTLLGNNKNIQDSKCAGMNSKEKESCQTLPNYLQWIKTMENAVTLSPTDVRGYILLSNIYEAYGANKNALITLKKGIDKVDKADINKLYFALANIETSAGNKKEALSYLKLIDKPSPEVATLVLMIKLQLTAKKNSISLVNQLIKKYPTSFDPLFLKGQLYLQQKKTTQAIQVFEDILNTYSNNVDQVEFALAKAYKQENLIQEALLHIINAIQVNPNNLEYHLYLIKQYIQENQIAQAKQHMANLVVSNDNVTILLLKAKIAKKEGDYIQASQLLREISQTRFSFAVERETLAIALLNNNLKYATEQGITLKKAGDTSKELQILLAKNLYLQHKYTQARASLKSFLHAKNVSVQAAIVLAMIYIEQNKTNTAINLLEKVWQKQPLHPVLLSLLFTTYEWTGQYQKALRSLNKLESLQYHTFTDTLSFKKALYLKHTHQIKKSQQMINQYHKQLLLLTL